MKMIRIAINNGKHYHGITMTPAQAKDLANSIAAMLRILEASANDDEVLTRLLLQGTEYSAFQSKEIP